MVTIRLTVTMDDHAAALRDSDCPLRLAMTRALNRPVQVLKNALLIRKHQYGPGDGPSRADLARPSILTDGVDGSWKIPLSGPVRQYLKRFDRRVYMKPFSVDVVLDVPLEALADAKRGAEAMAAGE